MTPITEEAAPEFPSKFEESGESETSEPGLQNTTGTGDSTGDEKLQNNSQATHDKKNWKTLEEEEVLGSETSGRAELTDELNGLLPEKETEESQIKTVDLEGATSVVNSDLSNAEPAVSNENHGVSSDDTEHISATHSFTEPNTGGLCLSNGDQHESNEVSTKCVESENCRSKEDKLMYPETDQVHSEKTNSGPKDNTCSFMPLVPNNTICSEQPSFPGSSSHSTNRLIEENGFEAVYDRNSINEGGIVKIQCEKCPA